MTTRRARPLTVDDIPPAARPPAGQPAPRAPAPVMAGEDAAARQRRFAEGLRALKVGGGSLNAGERTLMVVGGVLAPVGLILVLLGWYGAAHTPNLFEQVPYLISGGLFGIGLVFLGAFFYFAHWVTELVKESRSQSAAVIAAIDRLQQHLDAGRAARAEGRAEEPAAAKPSGSNGHPTLVATARGTMAHRPDCAVVAGKDGLHALSPRERLVPCKLCDPYGERPLDAG